MTKFKNWFKLFSSQILSHMDTPAILKFSHYLPTCLWRWNSVPKRRHIKFRRRELPRRKHTTIWYFCDNRLHLQLEVRLLIFTVCTCV